MIIKWWNFEIRRVQNWSQRMEAPLNMWPLDRQLIAYNTNKINNFPMSLYIYQNPWSRSWYNDCCAGFDFCAAYGPVKIAKHS